ncbi:MAG TPA: hypothetical protein VKA10_08020, partial [Prolixibacteraceae bacterium]|nr:hypothetical protein [Prolixibacteraceae bacterium]
GAGVTINPIKNVTARVFADYMGGDVKQQSLATFLAYTGNKLIVGAEYNYQQNVDMIDGQDMYGTSFYATYKPSGQLKVFGRYDDLNYSTLEGVDLPWQIEDVGQLIMAGLEYSPIKGVKLAPNFRIWNPDSESLETINSVYLNCELKF